MTGFIYDAQSRCLRTICFDTIYIYIYACMQNFFINNFRLYTHLDSVHHQLYDLLVSFCNNFFSNSRRTCIFFFFFKRNSFLDFYSLRAQSLRFFFFGWSPKYMPRVISFRLTDAKIKCAETKHFRFFFFFSFSP